MAPSPPGAKQGARSGGTWTRGARHARRSRDRLGAGAPPRRAGPSRARAGPRRAAAAGARAAPSPAAPEESAAVIATVAAVAAVVGAYADASWAAHLTARTAAGAADGAAAGGGGWAYVEQGARGGARGAATCPDPPGTLSNPTLPVTASPYARATLAVDARLACEVRRVGGGGRGAPPSCSGTGRRATRASDAEAPPRRATRAHSAWRPPILPGTRAAGRPPTLQQASAPQTMVPDGQQPPAGLGMPLQLCEAPGRSAGGGGEGAGGVGVSPGQASRLGANDRPAAAAGRLPREVPRRERHLARSPTPPFRASCKTKTCGGWGGRYAPLVDRAYLCLSAARPSAHRPCSGTQRGGECGRRGCGLQRAV
jgi:hypothetical protein